MNNKRSPFVHVRKVAASSPAPFWSHSRRSVLASVIVPASLCLALLSGSSAFADALFAPTDLILGGEQNTSTNQFLKGTSTGTMNSNSYPAAESPNHAIDGVSQKYLNFGAEFTGFLIQPSFNGGNGSVATSIQLWTANDAPGRDPASYVVWGSNFALDFNSSTFEMGLFTQVATGALNLPAGRNGTGATALITENSQTVDFINATPFKNYLITFPTLKGATLMQVAEVQLFGTAAPTNLLWKGNGGNLWDIDTTENWTAAGNASTYSNSNSVTFDDSTLVRTINISAGGVAPSTVEFQHNTKSYTFNGDSIVSPGTLTLNGTAPVTLNNATSFAAGITVNAGTLNIGASGSLAPAPLAINNLNTNNPQTAVVVNLSSPQTVTSLSGSLAIPTSGVNTIVLNLNGTLTVNQSTSTTFAGTISGNAGLIKEGTGTLTLTELNNYAGPTTVNGGVLRSSAPAGISTSALPPRQPVIVNSGARLVFGTDEGAGYYGDSVSSITLNNGTVFAEAGTHSTLPDLTLTGGTVSASGSGSLAEGSILNYVLDGDVTVLAGAPSKIDAGTILLRKDPTNNGGTNPVVFSVARGSGAADLTVSSVILDKGAGLIKSGNGILSLSNTNTYSGPTVINAGSIAVSNSSALGTGNVTINNGASLLLGAAPTISDFNNFAFNNGAGSDGTTVFLTSGTNQARSVFSSTPVSFSKGFTAEFIYTVAGNRLADGMTFTIQNSSPNAVGGPGGQLGYVGIQNSAAVEFNIYTGGGSPVGTNYAVGTSGVYLPSAPVNFASGNPVRVSLAYDPTAHTLTENLFDLVTGGTYSHLFPFVDYSTVIGGTQGYVGFTGSTGGFTSAQSVSNFNFYNFSEGVSLLNNLIVPADAAIGLDVQPSSAGGAGSATLRGDLSLGLNARLNITGGATATNTPYSLNVVGVSLISGNATFDVANNGSAQGNVVFGDVVDQGLSSMLTKLGNGILTIGGTATYAGVTSVEAGSLVVNGSLSGDTTTIKNGAALGGAGTVTNVIVANGGSLAPGNGIGTLTTGPLSFQNGSVFRLEMGATTSDQVAITGAGSLEGIIALGITLLADPQDGITFTILNGTAPLNGYASGARFGYFGNPLAQGDIFTVTNGGFTQVFEIDYTADGGRDVTLFAVPEPGTAMLMFAGVGVLLGLRRPRRDA